MRALAAVLVLACAATASAASRGQYGGTLRVAYAGELPEADPLLADSPHEAAVLQLATRGVCRLERDQRVTPVLASELVREPSGVRVLLRPNVRAASGKALGAQDVAQAWMRLNAADTRSPYRALLFPLKGEGRYLAQSGASSLPLELSFPWPDLERTLCHPALSVPELNAHRTPLAGAGPYLPTRALGVYVANWSFVQGRPYADRLSLTAGDARASQKLLNLGDAEVGLGTFADGFNTLPPAPALFATYLAFQPSRTGPGLRDALERVFDRGDLTRFFVRAPSVAMTALLPPALMPQDAVPRPGAAPAPPQRELTLQYDATLPDQKAVAERLQVKLHDAGYRVSLRGLSRTALRAKWATGEYDLLLHAVLLPPAPAAALAVALETGGRHDLLAKELPPLGAIADAAQRDQKARERAAALLNDVNLIPLYAQSLRVSAAGKVQALDYDGYGVPQLDAAFFGGP